MCWKLIFLFGRWIKPRNSFFWVFCLFVCAETEVEISAFNFNSLSPAGLIASFTKQYILKMKWISISNPNYISLSLFSAEYFEHYAFAGKALIPFNELMNEWIILIISIIPTLFTDITVSSWTGAISGMADGIIMEWMQVSAEMGATCLNVLPICRGEWKNVY